MRLAERSDRAAAMARSAVSIMGSAVGDCGCGGALRRSVVGDAAGWLTVLDP